MQHPEILRYAQDDNIILLLNHPPQRPTAQQMQMQVRDFLSAVEAAVGDDAVAGFIDAFLARDLAEGTE